MVRFKNRYLLCEVLFDTDGDSEQEIQAALQGVVLRNAIADSILLNFGDLGAAQTSLNLQIKYVNTTTRLFIVRCARDHIDLLWNSISFLKSLMELRVRIRVLHCSGTIKKQEIVAKRYLSRWIHKMLLNPTLLESVKTHLLEQFQKARQELQELEQ